MCHCVQGNNCCCSLFQSYVVIHIFLIALIGLGSVPCHSVQLYMCLLHQNVALFFGKCYKCSVTNTGVMRPRLEHHFGEFGWYELSPPEDGSSALCSLRVVTEPANIYARE